MEISQQQVYIIMLSREIPSLGDYFTEYNFPTCCGICPCRTESRSGCCGAFLDLKNVSAAPVLPYNHHNLSPQTALSVAFGSTAAEQVHWLCVTSSSPSPSRADAGAAWPHARHRQSGTGFCAVDRLDSVAGLPARPTTFCAALPDAPHILASPF